MSAAIAKTVPPICRRRAAPAGRCIRLALAILGSLLVVGGLDESLTVAQERISVREAYVPAENPQSWPPGPWVARPTKEYRQILADLAKEPPPPRAQFERITYFATLDGDSLTQGKFTAEIRLRGFEPAYVSLGEPTCALHHLGWPDRPAVWGLSPEGETLLRVPSEAAPLTGEWSLQGRAYFGRVEFEAALLPAVISTMEVRLPAAKRLTVSDEISMHVAPDRDPHWRTWVLDLGQTAHVHLIVSDASAEAASPQRIAERVTRYSLRPDGLIMQADFQVDSSGGATDRLVFETAANVDVTSVSLGNELELPFQLVRDDENGTASVMVPLESGVLEGRITVEVRGNMPLHSEGRVALPPITLKQFSIVSSRLHVTVHRPLELLDYHTERCRLVTSTLIRHQTDHLEFEDWSVDSRVTVEWDVPPADVVADVIASADLNDAHPISRTLMRLTARSGSTYELRCRIPSGWRVTRVTSEPWHRLPQISWWKTVTDEEGDAELQLEFRNSLTTSEPLFVEVWAARTADRNPAAIDVPLVVPRVPTLRDVRLAVRPSPDQTVNPSAASAFRPVKSSEFRAPWTEVIADWEKWLDGPITDDPSADELLYFAAENASDSEMFLLAPVQRTLVQQSPVRHDQTNAAGQSMAASASTNALESKTEIAARPPSQDVLLADVTVDTLISTASDAPCVTTVAYRFLHPVSSPVVEFDLPSPAEWISARIGGEPAAAHMSGRTARVRLPSDNSTEIIEIEYRAPFRQSQLWGDAQIPLPLSPLSITSLQWRVHLPEPFRLRSSTTGTSIEATGVGWQERLLGPLGAASETSAFWPFNTASSPASAVQDDTQGEDARDPSEQYRIESRSAPFTADHLRLAVWREDRARHLGWVLLFAALVAVVLLRRLPGSRWATVRAAWIVGMGILAALAPDSLAIPCGGVFLGSLAGAVLPARWSLRDGFIRGEPRSVGSTRSLAGAISPLVAISVLLANSAVAFQREESEPPTPPPTQLGRAELPTAASYDALIPVRSEEATLDETPVVYVSPALLSRWKARKHSEVERPAYLLRAATYAITSDYQSRPQITASFDVVLIEMSPTPRIALPLKDIVIDNDAPCRVNGHVATVIPMRDGAGIAVEVPPLTRGSLPESDGDDRQRGELESDALLRIELGFRPRPNKERASRAFRVEIPALVSSVAEVQSRKPGVDQRPVNGLGQTTIDGEKRIIRTELGPVTQLDIDLTDAGEDSGASMLVPELAVSLIEAHPRQMSVRTKLSYPARSVASEQLLETLELVLPPDTRVTNVLVPGLVSSIIETHKGSPTRLQLALENRPRERLDIEIAYLLPADSTGESVQIPPIPFIPGDPPDTTMRHVVGIHPRTGFWLPEEAQELAGENIGRVTPTSFAQSWGGSLAIEPIQAFSLTSPQPLRLAVAAVEPIREAAVREVLTVDRSRFQWEADIDIECLAAPVAAHRLQIDPRLKITSIRVVQNGADRLVRWSRRDPAELTLLLTDDLIGRQNIHLIGELPLPSDEPIDLPEFTINQTTVTQHELTIRSPSGWTVAVWNADSQPMGGGIATKSNSSNEASEFEYAETFDLLDASPPTKVRIADAAATFDFERVTTIQSRTDGQWQLQTVLQFPQGSLLPPRVQVTLPADWTRFGPLTTRPPHISDPQRDNDNTVYLFDSQQPDAPLKELEFTVTFPAPRDESWTVPDLHVQQGSLTRHLLVISGDVPFEPTGDAQDVPLDERRPEGGPLADKQRVDNTGSMRRRSYASQKGAWRLSRGRVSGTDDHIERMETVVWNMPGRQMAGVTAAQIALRKSDEVTVAYPPEFEIVRATLDGGLLLLTPDDSSLLRIPVSRTGQGTQLHTLRLWWTQPRTPSLVRSVIVLPRFEHIPVMTETVLLLGTAETILAAPRGWTALTNWDWSDEAMASGSFDLPVSETLLAAGVVPQRANQLVSPAAAFLLEKRAAEPSGDAFTTMTIWSVHQRVRRAVLIGLLAALAGLIAWKTDVWTRTAKWTASQTTRTYGGVALLASLIWMFGPGAMGFLLLVVSVSLWMVAVWQEWTEETTFSVLSDSSD